MEKAEELARLKEFSENIIESVNVGILVVDSTAGSRPGTVRSKRCSASPASEHCGEASTIFLTVT